MENINESISEIKDDIKGVQNNVKKTLSEKFFTILKWLALTVVVAMCVSNMFINYSEGKFDMYNLEIVENRKSLDSIIEKIEESKLTQSKLDQEILISETKSIEYKIKLNKLIKDYEKIRKNVNKNDVDFSYNIVRKHLDSLRARNREGVQK